MSGDDGYKDAIDALASITDREMELLNDEFHRFSSMRRFSRDIRKIIELVERMVQLERSYMTTKSSQKMAELGRIRKLSIKNLNLAIDQTVNNLKVVFRRLLSDEDVKDVRKRIDEENKLLKDFRFFEMHNYRGMKSLLEKLDMLKKKSPMKDDVLEEERERIIELMKDIWWTVKEDMEVESLNAAVEEILEKMRNLHKSQADFVRNEIDLLKRFKLDDKDRLLSGLEVNIKYKSTINALRENFRNLQANLKEEKEQVFDVLNENFMKKKRDAERVFEYVFDRTSHTNLLGVSDVTLYTSAVTSIVEAYELMLVFKDFESLFSRPAKQMIKEKERFYKRMMKQTERRAGLAYMDQLTDVPNRLAFAEKMEELRTRGIDRAALISLDIDYFKAFNSAYGHEGGDVVLRSVAQAIRAELKRSTDEIYRLGGEEFVILLERSTPDGAFRIAEKVRKKIEQMDIDPLPVTNAGERRDMWLEGKLRVIKDGSILFAKKGVGGSCVEISRRSPEKVIDDDREGRSLEQVEEGTVERAWITISFGIASIPENTSSPDKLAKIADKALQMAKDQGRNRTVIAKKEAA